MTPIEIVDNNKLIAEFMGYKLAECRNGLAWESPHRKAIEDKFDLHGRLFYTRGSSYYVSLNSYFGFNNDWNKLMIIVERITEMNVYAEPRQKVFASLCPKIEVVYSAVIDFINWYNSDEPKNLQP